MHHLFVALRSHVDVAKFEFEDGVVRQAAATLLAEESTIRAVSVDIATERTLALQDIGQSSPWAGTILVSYESPDDIDEATIAELVAEVGVVDQAWHALSTTVAGIEGDWHGSVIPGVKVSLVASPPAGTSQQHFHESLQVKLAEVHAALPGVGQAVVSSLEESDADVALASFWFQNEAALNAAAHSKAFAPVLSNDVVDLETLQILMAVEHRLTPNPNAWSMPTGPLMPIRDDPSNE